MLKVILGFALLFNSLISVYNWGIYAHNSGISKSQIIGFENLIKSNGDLPKVEIENLLFEAKINQINYLVSRKEWLIKLLIDLSTFFVFLIYYIKSKKIKTFLLHQKF
jgi:hypothetical protein